MKAYIILLTVIIFYSCRQPDRQISNNPALVRNNTKPTRTYTEIRHDIEEKRKLYSKINLKADTSKAYLDIRDFWVNMIGTDLYEKWKGTPWDFNGITNTPQEGSIACGYFVSSILMDMNVKINRIRMSTCPSLQMMKSLSIDQKVINLSYLNYPQFNDYIKRNGKAVYIIGLDFHTGIIVNDGTENWFIHSNYIRRQGVIKETVLSSAALMHSKTRWMTSLTGSKDFIARWMKGN